MADDQDQSQKTEEPSQKKLDDAHKKGDVAKSRDVAHWFVLLAAALGVAISANSSASGLRSAFSSFLEHSYAVSVEPGALLDLYRFLLSVLGAALFLPLLLLVIGSVAGHLVQGKPVLTAERMKPTLSKLSPLKGAKRLFSASNFVEFLKTIVKFIVVGGVVIMLVVPEISRFDQMMTQGIEELLPLVRAMTLRMLIGVLSIMGVVAGLDYLFQVLQNRKKLKMSKQELKDEYKQSDGDPHIKGRLRQIRMERSRKRMMAAVPEADVVVTNPTHYAVAMKYDPEEMAAPRVVAKGADLIALRIRELAKEHNVPIVENPPLARALYANVELDREVPPEHYHAVAEVIGFIMKLRRNGGRR